jgi:hypothetical protein
MRVNKKCFRFFGGSIFLLNWLWLVASLGGGPRLGGGFADDEAGGENDGIP